MKYTNLTGYKDEFEGLHVVDDKSWYCEIDDGKEVPLSLLIEVTDMYGATGEPEFKDYPFVFSVGIIASKPHKSFYEGEGKPTRQGLLYDCNGYMGTIPVDHKLLRTDELNKKLMGELKAKVAKIVTHTHDYGTLAAQEGKGSSISYPQFKTAKDAYEFAKALVDAYGHSIMRLVGFTLDQPINMIGDTGWSQIETMVKGVKR